MSDNKHTALQGHLRTQTEAREVLDVAKHCGDRVFELVRMHAMTMPTVSAAIGLGLLVAGQVYAETLLFAANSMDGDSEDAGAVCSAAGTLFRDLLSEIDIPEVKDWSNAERGKFHTLTREREIIERISNIDYWEGNGEQLLDWVEKGSYEGGNGRVYHDQSWTPLASDLAQPKSPKERDDG